MSDIIPLTIAISGIIVGGVFFYNLYEKIRDIVTETDDEYMLRMIGPAHYAKYKKDMEQLK